MSENGLIHKRISLSKSSSNNSTHNSFSRRSASILKNINPDRACIPEVKKAEQEQYTDHDSQHPENRFKNGIGNDKQGK